MIHHQYFDSDWFRVRNSRQPIEGGRIESIADAERRKRDLLLPDLDRLGQSISDERLTINGIL
jgi:hypothetical protein